MRCAGNGCPGRRGSYQLNGRDNAVERRAGRGAGAVRALLRARVPGRGSTRSAAGRRWARLRRSGQARLARPGLPERPDRTCHDGSLPQPPSRIPYLIGFRPFQSDPRITFVRPLGRSCCPPGRISIPQALFRPNLWGCGCQVPLPRAGKRSSRCRVDSIAPMIRLPLGCTATPFHMLRLVKDRVRPSGSSPI